MGRIRWDGKYIWLVWSNVLDLVGSWYIWSCGLFWNWWTWFGWWWGFMKFTCLIGWIILEWMDLIWLMVWIYGWTCVGWHMWASWLPVSCMFPDMCMYIYEFLLFLLPGASCPKEDVPVLSPICCCRRRSACCCSSCCFCTIISIWFCCSTPAADSELKNISYQTLTWASKHQLCLICRYALWSSSNSKQYIAL